MSGIEGREVPAGALDVGMYRDDLRLRPTVALHPTVILAGTSPARRWSWSTTCCSAVAQHARRWMPCPAPGGQGPCNWPFWSTEDTAICPSAPTTWAKTADLARRRRAGDPDRNRRNRCRAPGARWRKLNAPSALHPGCDPPEALAILDTARELAQVADRPVKKLPTLRGRTVVNLFFEDSTRTRISFEAAAKRLSADVINFSAKGRAFPGRIPERHGIDVAGDGRRRGRDPASGQWCCTPLGQQRLDPRCGHQRRGRNHEHPTQALLDAYTMRDHLRDGQGSLEGLNVVIVGDVLHSRVARSNVWLLDTLGADVTLVAPPTLLPVGVGQWPCRISYDLDEAIVKADVVMMLRVQMERMNAAFFPSAREYSRRYGLDVPRMSSLPDHAIVMHPGPMNRGMEIAADVADADRSVILDQVTNGVHIRMAVLYLLMGGQEA